jgi:hypothetical protein
MNAPQAVALLAALGALCVSLPAEDLAKPRIEVFKAKRLLQLFDGDKLIKTYRVGLGTNPVPPEGSYFICDKNPQSKFHLSLAISYPGPADARRGLDAGLISKIEYKSIMQASAEHRSPPWNTKLGGEVFVHGNGASSDWTWGCVALDNPDIEELYRLVPVRTPIRIHP